MQSLEEPFQEVCRGYGPVPARLMFVGISAGRLGALQTTVPFTKDASGRILLRCLKRLGLSKSDEFSLQPVLVDCYITNLVKGRCLTSEGLNRLPTEVEVNYWVPKMVQEIRLVRPEMILALGDLVYDAFVAKLNNLAALPQIGCPFMVALLRHPRWYQSHGALALNSPAFKTMVNDYRRVIQWGRRRKKE